MKMLLKYIGKGGFFIWNGTRYRRDGDQEASGMIRCRAVNHCSDCYLGYDMEVERIPIT